MYINTDVAPASASARVSDWSREVDIMYVVLTVWSELARANERGQRTFPSHVLLLPTSDSARRVAWRFLDVLRCCHAVSSASTNVHAVDPISRTGASGTTRVHRAHQMELSWTLLRG